jgi:hypothetical protein
MLSLPLSFLSGLLVKLSDSIADGEVDVGKRYAWLFGVLYAVPITALLFFYPALVSLFAGVMAAVALSGKIDAKPHLLALIVFAAFFAVAGTFNPELLLFAVFFTAAISDEIADAFHEKTGRFAFFRYRPFLEAVSFAVSLLTGNFLYWFTVVSFDAGYLLVSSRRFSNSLLNGRAQ